MIISKKEYLTPSELQHVINWWNRAGNFNLDLYEKFLANRMSESEIIGWAAVIKMPTGRIRDVKIYTWEYFLASETPECYDVIQRPEEISLLMEPNSKEYIVLKANPIYKTQKAHK